MISVIQINETTSSGDQQTTDRLQDEFKYTLVDAQNEYKIATEAQREISQQPMSLCKPNKDKK